MAHFRRNRKRKTTETQGSRLPGRRSQQTVRCLVMGHVEREGINMCLLCEGDIMLPVGNLIMFGITHLNTQVKER